MQGVGAFRKALWAALACYKLSFEAIGAVEVASFLQTELESLSISDRGNGYQFILPNVPDSVLQRGYRQVGDINIETHVNSVVTTALENSYAHSEVGVARGGAIDVDANIRGEVNTVAKNNSSAYVGLGIAEGHSLEVDVDVRGDVNTIAKSHSSANSTVGEAYGLRHDVNAQVRSSVNTIAINRSSASSRVGAAYGDNSDVNVSVRDSVNTIAKSGSIAISDIGVAHSGDVTVVVDEVNTIASHSGAAYSEIGSSSGNNVSVGINGSVSTIAKSGGQTSTRIGVDKSVYVKGDVVNSGGDLAIGGACKARRDGQCCIEIHRRYCVLRKVPPDSKGRCPPRFEHWGLCYLYSDKKHRIGRR